MDARARYEATMEAGPPEGEPEPCPMCGEPLTPLLDGGSECEVNGCVPCPLCEQGEATGGGVYPCARCRLGDDFDA